MNKFSEWLKKEDPEIYEGLGILKIVKGLMGMGDPTGCGCGCSAMSQKPTTIKGTGPNKKSALKNALEKIDAPEDVEADLIDKENDVYTFKVKM